MKYLLEVCDPCQTVGYTVNGWKVSDFYTPRYFDPVRNPRRSTAYRGVERPLQILDGGYITWIDPARLRALSARRGRPSRCCSATRDAGAHEQALRTVVDTDPRTPRVTSGSLHLARTARTDSLSYRGVREAPEGSALRAAESILSLALEP